MMSNAILMALVPVFFVLLLGYAAGRFHVVDNLHVDALNALVMDFAVPASLFAATASASRSEMIEQVPLFLVLGITMSLLYAAWYLAARRLFKVSRPDASIQALTVGFPNLAGVGLPILTSVAGQAGAVPVAVALATGSVLISPVTLIMAEMDAARSRGEEMAARQMLTAVGRAITKPVVLAPVFGILFSVSDLSLDALAHACLALIGSSAAGVALFLTGAILSAQSFRLNWKIAAATVAADVVRPARSRCNHSRLSNRSRHSEDGHSPRRGAFRLFRHPVCGQLPAGLRSGRLDGHFEHRIQRRDHGGRDRRALSALGGDHDTCDPVLGTRRTASGHVRPDGRCAGSDAPVCTRGNVAGRQGSARFRAQRI
ncbi:putative permease [Bradyrhizobium sp. i1.4.4]